MTFLDIIGLGAGFFVILAFYMRDQLLLRVCALISNVLFVIYGFTLTLWPILILHAVLLPLNLLRLSQLNSPQAKANGDQSDPEKMQSRARNFEAFRARYGTFSL